MAGIQHLYDRYEWHARKLRAHLEREPFTTSLLDEAQTRKTMKQISDRIAEKGGAVPEPIPLELDLRGMETDARDSFQSVGGLAEMERGRDRQAAELEATHAAPDQAMTPRQQKEHEFEVLRSQVREAYARGEPGAEDGAAPMEAERKLDGLAAELMSGNYGPQAEADRPEPEPEAEP
jgi:hypothetical protein